MSVYILDTDNVSLHQRNHPRLVAKLHTHVTQRQFYPLIPRPLLPRNGGEGRKAVSLSLAGGEAARKRQNYPLPRPWGRG